MEKSKVLSLISEIKYDSASKSSFLALEEYLKGIDIHLETKWKRRILKMLSKIDNPYADILTSILNRDNPGDRALLQLSSDSGISLKEFDEARYFNQQVKSVLNLPFDCVYDMCAGNGLNGFYWLSKKQTKFLHSYDIKENKYFKSLSKNFTDYQYHIEDIFKTDINPSDKSAFISIHACGNLTDRIIDIAASKRKPFAIMPCCYRYHDNPYFSPESIEYFDNKDDAIDAARIKRAESSGFKIVLRKIPQEITKKNRIIIGLPY
jgi:hypothetical protein